MCARGFLDIDDSASIIIEWRSGGGPSSLSGSALKT